MKGGNTDSKTGDVQGYDTGDYATFDLTGGKGKGKGKGKPKKSSSKFSDFDFEKEWKEFETSYNQKYGGASTKKKPAKKASSAKKQTKKTSTKKPAKKASSAKKPKRKTQRGGDESGATYAPEQFFDANATMSAPSSDQSNGSLIDGLFPHSPNNPVVGQTGGAKKKTSKAKKDTKTTKPKKDSKKKEAKKTKTATKSNNHKATKKDNILEKIKKFFSM
jgi:hypothetical protein